MRNKLRNEFSPKWQLEYVRKLQPYAYIYLLRKMGQGEKVDQYMEKARQKHFNNPEKYTRYIHRYFMPTIIL